MTFEKNLLKNCFRGITVKVLLTSRRILSGKLNIQPPVFSCKGQEISQAVEMRDKPGMK